MKINYIFNRKKNKAILKSYRPSPTKLEGNFFIEILTKHLRNEGWSAINFKFWRFSHLLKYRNKCKIIHLHWPESFWRSKTLPFVYLKSIRFILVFYFSTILGYKWVFSAHNVIPHYKVKSQILERFMRYFILKKFDLVIGLAYNTKNDLKLVYGTSGKKYILALHGTYENYYPVKKTKKDFRTEKKIPLESITILITNSSGRNNKGTEELLNILQNSKHTRKIHFIITGEKPQNYSELITKGNFTIIPGKVPDEELGTLFSSIDYLFLNYKYITTSGLFFLAVTFGIPVIAPSLPFFVMHTNPNTAILYDYNQPITEQLDIVLRKINEGWKKDEKEMEKLKKQYDNYRSAKIIAENYKLISKT